MITITDLRGDKPRFAQWDVDRVLKITGAAVQPQLRFANDKLTRALVVPAEADGTDWKCRVPNFILQYAGPMAVSVFEQTEDEGRETCAVCYVVSPRVKPQDYAYEENIGYVNWVQKSEEAEELLKQMRLMLLAELPDAEAAVLSFAIDGNGDLIYTRDTSSEEPFDLELDGDVMTRNLGHVTAYAYAKAGGYTGTEAEFRALMAANVNAAAKAAEAAQSAENAAQSAAEAGHYAGVLQDQAEDAEAWAIGSRGGIPVGSTDEAWQNNAMYYEWLSRQNANRADEKAQETINYFLAHTGSPLLASSLADMTDHSKIYVVSGFAILDNLVEGHWYYWDGTAWTDSGHAYQGVGVRVDTSLSVAGVPADAKATGDAIAALSGGGGSGGGTAALEAVYPVGSIYMNVNATNPATLFGFGSWVRIQDRFLLAAGGTYAAGSTGGAASRMIQAANVPEHNHAVWMDRNIVAGGVTYYEPGVYKATGFDWTSSGGRHVLSISTHDDSSALAFLVTEPAYADSNDQQALETMPPYLTVYVWQRTA